MKKITLQTGLLMALVLSFTDMTGQTTGDYRTNAVTTTNVTTNWDRYDGSSWVAATVAPFSSLVSCIQRGNTSTSTSVTLTAANPLIRTNQFVTGSGVPVGTLVAGISGTALTLSNATTSTVANTALTFQDSFVTPATCTTTSGSPNITLAANTYPIVVGMAVSGTGVPAGTKVNTVTSATSITLSNNATASSTVVALTFYTKETTATIKTGDTFITLSAENSLVQPGMLVSSIVNFTSSYFSAGTVVTSVSGTTINISQKVPSQTATVVPVIFGYNSIPNLYINHNVTGSSNVNTKGSTIGNVYVNNAANDYPAGSSGVTPTDVVFQNAPGASALAISFKTINVANSSTMVVGAPTSGSPLSNLALWGTGNVINNNGTIDFTPVISGANTSRLNTNFVASGNITGAGTFTFGTINIPNTGTNVTMSANCTINNITAGTALTSTVSSGATLTINEGFTLSNNNSIAAGTLTNSGNLILKSSATGTASLLSTNTVNNVTQQRYLSSSQRGWRLLSNPLATTTFETLATTSNITIGTNYTGEYDSALNTWTSTDGTASMDTQKAYKLFITGQTGESPTYTTGPSNVTLSYKGAAANTVPGTITTVANQFYLVANPYTAPVSFSSIIGASTGLSNTVSYYNPTNASLDVKVKAGGYDTVIISGAAGSATDVVIPAMGAIFVQATTAGTINVPKTAIFTGTPLQTGTYNHKTTQTKIALANTLKVDVNSGNTYYDAINFQFKTVGDTGSNIDFGKLPNTILDFYSINGSNNRAVSELELKDQIIPLGITSTVQKSYTLKVSENTIPAGFEAVLIDNVLNTTTPLIQGTTYDFAIDSTPASQGNTRFAIHLKTAGSLAVQANAMDTNIQLYPNPSHGQFNISNSQEGTSTIEISSLSGQVIHTQKLNSGINTIQTNNWSAGVYILKASNNGNDTTKKLIIQ